MLFIVAFIVATWFWFSLSPGAWLGFALTIGDWGRLVRGLGDKDLQTRTKLRSAARQSFLTHAAIFGLGFAGGVLSGNYTFSKALPFLLAAIAGLVVGYVLLRWSTRSGGWYGAA